MAKSKKNIKPKTTLITNEDGQTQEVTEVGVPGLFPPQEWDVNDEVNRMDAFHEFQRGQRELSHEN